MQETVLTKSLSAPFVDRREILRYAGVREGSPEMEALLDECLGELGGKVTQCVCYLHTQVRLDGDCADLGFARVTSRSLCKHLGDCDGTIVFCATVGVELDRLIARYSRISPARAVMLDAIGTERIEALCDAFEMQVKEEWEEKGKGICPRFSPGYGDLPLDFQRPLITVLDAPKRIGVALNESLLMSPSKSVTAIIGLKKKN
ncbi:MAG: Vitamin B12 dependent methionine synthase activation subunit [Clostridia bacterium]|nr:Vitamin B12 dependent methionine synthase activation subunit [Clostridia bacterium]